jgi:hypothetical protein
MIFRLLQNSFRSPSTELDERMIPEMIEKFPFMLRFSKHSEPFFNSLIFTRYFLFDIRPSTLAHLRFCFVASWRDEDR